MPALVDNMAWKSQVPWHGLGVQAPKEATGEEMLKLAGMNWRVQRRSLAMRTADGKSTLTAQLKGYKAIVREDTNYVFQVATEGYYPVQNIEVVDYFREYCEAGQATMETVGSLRGGAVIWALAKLNPSAETDLGEGDKLLGYMMLATSHDGSLRTIGKPTEVCIVCWNTLMAAVREKSTQEFKMKHTRKWTPEIAKEAKRVMGMAIEQVQETNALASDLSKVELDEKGRLEFVFRLMVPEEKEVKAALTAEGDASPLKRIGRLGKTILECIDQGPGAELPSRKNTMWGAVNGVTYFSDHVRGKSQDWRMYATWFGGGATLKSQSMNVAAQMAGIKVR